MLLVNVDGGPCNSIVLIGAKDLRHQFNIIPQAIFFSYSSFKFEEVFFETFIHIFTND